MADSDSETERDAALVAAVASDHAELSPAAESDPESVFHLSEKLGEGSYGSVWRAEHRATHAAYAIKRVSIDNDLEELQGEIAFMKGCRSPFIIRYFGSYVKGSELWIVMELADCGSVADLMKVTKKTLDEAQISLVCRYVLQGLEYLHARKKLHRDIKAGNVLLNSAGEGKLADFGVSGQLADTMAKRHTVIGTPFWMAPEVIQETGYNHKADVWSVGITAIELADGKPPYANVHPMRAIFMIPSRPPPTLAEPAKWSAELNDFIAKCLTKTPDKRPDTAELLQHPFIAAGPRTPEPIMPLIQAQQQILQEVGREKALGVEQPTEQKTPQQPQEQQQRPRQPAGTVHNTVQGAGIVPDGAPNTQPLEDDSDADEVSGEGTFCVRSTRGRADGGPDFEGDGGSGSEAEDEDEECGTHHGSKTAEPSWMEHLRQQQTTATAAATTAVSATTPRKKDPEPQAAAPVAEPAPVVVVAAAQADEEARPLQDWPVEKLKSAMRSLQAQMDREIEAVNEKYAEYLAKLRKLVEEKRREAQQL